ncbi:permease [Pseudomonas oryzihabitans]|nr:permease [Pseudomonas psychrotolerans]
MFRIELNKSADNVPLAIIAIVVTVFVLSLGDALIKLASGSFVIWQILVLRSLMLLPVLLLLIRVAGIKKLPSGIFWIALRSIMLIGMWVLYYLSLPNVTLSAAAAAYYTLPIFITLFSALFSGDRIGIAGWLAVAVGFAGVLLILRPSAEDFNLYTTLPLGSAMLYAGAMIITRQKCREQHPLTLSLYLNLGFLIVGVAVSLILFLLPADLRHGFLFSAWSPMGKAEWLSIGLLAIALLIGSVGAAIAYQNGPSAMVGTFDFAYVGFAVIWGFVFFGEVPDSVSTLGMVMIIGAGILSLRQ